MKAVIQRVSRAKVSIEGNVVGSIGKGILILVGVGSNDTSDNADYIASKCPELRIFSDSNGKMNLSLKDIDGCALVVSQFTLYGNCRKGRRPSYARAAAPEKGEKLYEYFVKKLREHIFKVETGVFGALMDVELVNDGPVTLILEKEN